MDEQVDSQGLGRGHRRDVGQRDAIVVLLGIRVPCHKVTCVTSRTTKHPLDNRPNPRSEGGVHKRQATRWGVCWIIC